MKFRFAAIGQSTAAELEAKGTRAITALGRPSAMAAAQSTAKMPTPAGASPETVPAKGGGIPVWVWIVVGLVVAAGVAFFVLKGSA